MITTERRRPSNAAQKFTQHEDDMCVELACSTCGEIIRFTKYARPEEIERELTAHDCAKSALEVDFEMFELVRCPECGGSSCRACQLGTVLFPRTAAERTAL